MLNGYAFASNANGNGELTEECIWLTQPPRSVRTLAFLNVVSMLPFLPPLFVNWEEQQTDRLERSGLRQGSPAPVTTILDIRTSMTPVLMLVRVFVFNVELS